MYIVKKRKLGVYLMVGAVGREWTMTTGKPELATVFPENLAREVAKGANLMFRTDMWEAVKL